MVPWRTSLDAALKESKESGKPVFWYVPSLAGSPMDRQDWVDWSMMAGPFSWPRTVALLGDHYVPVRRSASKAQMKRFGLKVREFVEPGFIILGPDGKEQMRAHELTSLHPLWFLRQLKTGDALPLDTLHPGFLTPEQARRCLHGDTSIELDPGIDVAQKAEARWLLGAGQWSRRDEEGAKEHWASLVRDYPDSPLAAKAQMEIEGYGPFVRGLEWPVELPEKALVPSGDGTRLPDVYETSELWNSGARFLVHMQRSHGGFVDSIYDFGGTDSLPNVFSTVTAIAAIALLEAAHRKVEVEGLEEALQAALLYASDDARLAMQDTDERVWVYLYRIRLYTRWLDRRPQDKGRIQPLLEKATQDVLGMQADTGAWYHEYSSPFVTAQSLVALHDAKEHGVRIKGVAKIVERGVAALMQCRTNQGAYSYYYRPNRSPRSSIEEGVGRMPLGEEALWRWKAGRRGDIARAIELSFEHQHHLFAVQKYDDHASRYAYGGFFFWWDLWVRSEAILALPQGALRRRMLEEQRKVLLQMPEIDGAFIDSHEVGRAYGTGMALWCLALTEE